MLDGFLSLRRLFKLEGGFASIETRDFEQRQIQPDDLSIHFENLHQMRPLHIFCQAGYNHHLEPFFLFFLLVPVIPLHVGARLAINIHTLRP